MRTQPTFYMMMVSSLAVVVSVLALMVLRRISRDPKTAEAKIKLRPGETHKDFKILIGVNSLFFLALLGYVYAGYYKLEVLAVSMELIMFVAVIPVALVFYRIVRRLK